MQSPDIPRLPSSPVPQVEPRAARFAVITVCRNDLENLRRTAASVLAQENADFEWRVVDGASTDGTAEWLAGIGDPRLRWTSAPDRGLFDAMNRGIDSTRGKYLIFMNSGDLFHDERVLANTQAHLDSQPIEPALAYGDSVDFTRDGHEHRRGARPHDRVHRGMFAQHQAMFFRRSSLRYELDFPLTADYVFVARTLEQARSDQRPISKLPFAVCRFLLGGLNEQRRFRALKEDYRCRREVMKLPATTCAALYGAHWIHSVMKRGTPRLARLLRS